MAANQTSMQRSKILIIDDDSYFISMVTNKLQDICDVVSTRQPKEGLEIAQQHPLPDLIILDIMMPVISGYQICRELKQNSVSHGIPIIFVSGLDKPSERVRCFELGGVDFVAKPAEMSELEARIKNHLMLKFQREMLINLSYSDSLTGLMSKRSFEELLQSEWRRAKRREQAISMLICDVDNYIAYNEGLGTAEAEACLKRVAKIIYDTACRAGDTVARIENDRFAVVLPDCDRFGCLNVAQRVKDAVLKAKIKHPDSSASEFVTLSIGVAFIEPGENCTLNMLSEQADKALNVAKDNGRNRVGVAV